MVRNFVVALVIGAMVVACSGEKKEEAAQRPIDEINSVQHMKQPAPGKEAKKNVFSEKATERESWVAKEMRKEGYDPKNMTGKDYRKLLGAE
jgi:hypothetical protein